MLNIPLEIGVFLCLKVRLIFYLQVDLKVRLIFYLQGDIILVLINCE
jgi:hypothetical protein